MKKVLASLAIVVLASCGQGTTTETIKTDSTSVSCDTMKCKSDSTQKDTTTVVKDSTK